MDDIPTLSSATDLTPITPHTYAANLSSHYTIGTVPHGGYVTSVLQRAAALHFSITHARLSQPHLLTLHLSFLRRTSVGPALITIKDAKIGRQTSTIHISLSQKQPNGSKREEVVGYLTHTNFSTAVGPSFTTPWRLDPPPAPTPKNWAIVARGDDPNWAPQDSLPFANFRKASSRIRWMLPRKSPQPGMHDQWMGLSTKLPTGEYERWDNNSLGFIADMFPQLIESFLTPDIYKAFTPSGSAERRARLLEQKNNAKARFWYPTVVLNLEVKKAMPSEGVEWLFLRLLAKRVKDGRYDLEVVVMDEEGDVVALSQHVCFAVSAERNLQARGCGGESERKEKGRL